MLRLHRDIYSVSSGFGFRVCGGRFGVWSFSLRASSLVSCLERSGRQGVFFSLVFSSDSASSTIQASYNFSTHPSQKKALESLSKSRLGEVRSLLAIPLRQRKDSRQTLHAVLPSDEASIGGLRGRRPTRN